MKVYCETIEQSKKAQKKFESNGFQLINPKKSLQMQTFVIVFPPCWCFEKHLVHKMSKEADYLNDKKRHYGGCPLCDFNEKPVICSDSGESSGNKYELLENVKSFFSLVEAVKT